jgi:hypothetical protein
VHLKDRGRDFWLRFSTWISFPQALIIPLGPFQIFSKFAEIFAAQDAPSRVNNTGGKWKKSSIRKIFIIYFGHL